MSHNTDHNHAAHCACALSPKVALYCRSATENELAIEQQKDQLLRYVRQTGYDYLSWYIDNGEIGLTLDRPAMKRLLADIASGEIDIVVVAKSDRIARDMTIFAEFVEYSSEYSVQCVSADVGASSVDDLVCDPEFFRNIAERVRQIVPL